MNWVKSQEILLPRIMVLTMEDQQWLSCWIILIQMQCDRGRESGWCQILWFRQGFWHCPPSKILKETRTIIVSKMRSFSGLDHFYQIDINLWKWMEWNLRNAKYWAVYHRVVLSVPYYLYCTSMIVQKLSKQYFTFLSTTPNFWKQWQWKSLQDSILLKKISVLFSTAIWHSRSIFCCKWGKQVGLIQMSFFHLYSTLFKQLYTTFVTDKQKWSKSYEKQRNW